jgi:hypothetical protein
VDAVCGVVEWATTFGVGRCVSCAGGRVCVPARSRPASKDAMAYAAHVPASPVGCNEEAASHIPPTLMRLCITHPPLPRLSAYGLNGDPFPGYSRSEATWWYTDPKSSLFLGKPGAACQPADSEFETILAIRDAVVAHGGLHAISSFWRLTHEI